MKGKLLNIIVSLVSILVMFAMVEAVSRVQKGEYSFKNFLEEKSMFFRSAYPAEFAPDLLGWIPKSGVSDVKNVWGTDLTILENGIRSNGEGGGHLISSDLPPILAVGGSFTFGDQVSDHETYSAILEDISGRKVINAGVFGYGTDQAFLRAGKLIDVYRPEYLVFSVMSDHVFRCEISERNGVSKPYFDVSVGYLALKNIPVLPPSQEEAHLSSIRKVFGYSHFAHRMMMRLAPEYWLQGRWNQHKVHSDGEKVVCLIFNELEKMSKTNNIKIYVLLQYLDFTTEYHEVPLDDRLAVMDNIKQCLKETSLNVVDMREPFLELKKNDEEGYRKMYQGHMTATGNRFVATKLKEAMGL